MQAKAKLKLQILYPSRGASLGVVRSTYVCCIQYVIFRSTIVHVIAEAEEGGWQVPKEYIVLSINLDAIYWLLF